MRPGLGDFRRYDTIRALWAKCPHTWACTVGIAGCHWHHIWPWQLNKLSFYRVVMRSENAGMMCMRVSMSNNDNAWKVLQQHHRTPIESKLALLTKASNVLSLVRLSWFLPLWWASSVSLALSLTHMHTFCSIMLIYSSSSSSTHSLSVGRIDEDIYEVLASQYGERVFDWIRKGRQGSDNNLE